MNLPREWLEWGLLPEEFWQQQYRVFLEVNLLTQSSDGSQHHCADSEHYRFGLFNYWLAKKPGQAVLAQLEQLAQLDPDQLMASDALRLIKMSQARPGCA